MNLSRTSQSPDFYRNFVGCADDRKHNARVAALLCFVPQHNLRNWRVAARFAPVLDLRYIDMTNCNDLIKILNSAVSHGTHRENFTCCVSQQNTAECIQVLNPLSSPVFPVVQMRFGG